MKLTIHCFAGLAEAMQAETIVWEEERDGDVVTVSDLKQSLMLVYPQAALLIGASFLARNQAYAEADEQLSETDEIALIPPVSGGGEQAPSPAVGAQQRYMITNEPLSLDKVTRIVSDADHGASLAFIGTTREYTGGKRTVRLEYTAYVPMALKTLEQIGEEIEGQWPGTLTAIAHRLGIVEIGEASVIIAVSSPHRAACYEASRYAIERLKQIVPIWKKEIWEDGSEWKGAQNESWSPF